MTVGVIDTFGGKECKKKTYLPLDVDYIRLDKYDLYQFTNPICMDEFAAIYYDVWRRFDQASRLEEIHFYELNVASHRATQSLDTLQFGMVSAELDVRMYLFMAIVCATLILLYQATCEMDKRKTSDRYSTLWQMTMLTIPCFNSQATSSVDHNSPTRKVILLTVAVSVVMSTTVYQTVSGGSRIL